MSLDFLLEIGTEEIPHWMIPGALAQLAKLDLLGATPRVDATPRRLVVRAEGLPERTPDAEQVVKGPPITAGDKAAEGFAKKQGADASALRKAGNYYELVKSVPGRAVREILAESLPPAILGIQWPKTMFWTDRNGPRFIRPHSLAGCAAGRSGHPIRDRWIEKRQHHSRSSSVGIGIDSSDHRDVRK